MQDFVLACLKTLFNFKSVFLQFGFKQIMFSSRFVNNSVSELLSSSLGWPEILDHVKSIIILSTNLFANICLRFVFFPPVLYCTILYCAVLYCTVLHCTVLYCTALYSTALHCTVLYCTVLYLASHHSPGCGDAADQTKPMYYAVLYCTVLYCISPNLGCWNTSVSLLGWKL